MLVGLALTAVLLLPRPSAPVPRVAVATDVVAALPGTTVGPFRIEVEKLTVERLGDRTFAFVQMHLFRPGGPVAFEDRLRIDGIPELSGGFETVDTTWLVNNEYEFRPTMHHGALGIVPAVDHAGEARGVFAFYCDENRGGVDRHFDLTFHLPDGDVGRIRGIRPTVR